MNNLYALDYILLVLTSLFVLLSIWKGFIQSILGLMTWIGSIIITLIFYQKLSDYLSIYINKIDANPRKERKPQTSVIVVSITPEASAGSIFILFNVIGINAPIKPAINKFIIIAIAIVIPKRLSSNQ